MAVLKLVCVLLTRLNLSVLKLYPLFAFIDWPEGFYGDSCSLKCRYPNYGIHCHEECSQCVQELCNFRSGCPIVTVKIPDGNISFNPLIYSTSLSIIIYLQH